MEIRVLGPLEGLARGRPVALGGPKQRACLAALVLSRDGPVSVDRLVELLWGDAPPRSAGKTVHVFVSRLRKALGGDAIATAPGGYRLAVDPGAVDAWRFEQLLATGRRARDAGDSRRAAAVLRDALALWQGAPFADLAYEPFAQGEIARLEELRLVALEERVDADLELGRADQLIAELEALVRDHPLRERLRAQLMLALYRSGRQAEALGVYRSTRVAFDQELGIEPGPALRQLEEAILVQEPGLGATSRVPRWRTIKRRRKALWIGAGAVPLVVAAAAAAALLGPGGGGPPTQAVRPDSLAFIDARDNAVTRDIAVGSGPASVAVGGRSVWVANAGDKTLVRVDPGAKQAADRLGIGRIPTRVAFGRGAVWIASAIGHRGTLLRVDPGRGAVTAEDTVRVGAGRSDDLFAPPAPSSLAVGPGGVVTNQAHSRLWWSTGAHHARTVPLGRVQSIDGLAAGAGAVWVASGAANRVLRLNPRTGRVDARISVAAGPGTRSAGPDGIAVGSGAVWVTNTLAGTVTRIDPERNRVAATIGVGHRPTQLAVGAGAVWVLNAGEGSVSRIDPSRNAVTATIRVGANATGVAAGFGGVWVTVAGGPPRAQQAPRSATVVGLSTPRCAARVEGPRSPELLIASDLPSYGADPTVARTVADMRAAIRLVLERRGFRAGRYRLGYQMCNDALPREGSDPDLCASNARAFVLNPAVVGVIGSYNSFCSGIQLPTLNAAASGPVAMVSPTNTYIGLTRGGPATAADEPDRYYPTGARSYARLLASDDYQSAGIDLFLRGLGRHRVFLLDDGQATGYAGAVFARRAAKRAGLTIAGAARWSSAARGYATLATRIARAHADAVLLSGCGCANGAALVRDLRRVLGRRLALIGTDNFALSSGFSRTRAFDGVYLSMAGRPALALPSAGRAFLRDLAPARRFEDIDPAVAYAAQATTVLLDAIARSNGTRPSVVRQLLATRLRTGIAGPMRFTSEGDPAQAPIAIYRISSTTGFRPRRSVQGLEFVRVVEPASR